MAVVSIDLAYKKWEDIGACVLNRAGASIDVEFRHLPGQADPPAPESVARACIKLCVQHGAQLLLLDGPQGWKHPASELVHSRVCERELNTPAKTGLPTVVKPSPYTRFVAFSIEVFDALDQFGWPRLKDASAGIGRSAVESFPNASWRSLELPALPAKRRASSSVVRGGFDRLRELFPLTANASPNHDQLQALVAGLAGLAMECGDPRGYRLVGTPPAYCDGFWREGFIVVPSPPSGSPLG